MFTTGLADDDLDVGEEPRRPGAVRLSRRRVSKVRKVQSRRRISSGANKVGIHRRRNKRTAW